MDEETVKREPGFMVRNKKLFITIFVLFIFGFGGNYYIKKSTVKKELGTSSIIDSLITDGTGASEEGPVANVNGVEITRAEYQSKLKEIASALTRLGYNINNSKITAQVRQQATAELVNFELLYQNAVNAGYNVSEAEVETAYQAVLADMGSQEVLELTLKDRDMTTDDLLENINRQLIIDAYIKASTEVENVSISDEEVAEYYGQISVTSTDIPPLENIALDLKTQLFQEKQQQVVTDFIQVLRTDATIEVYN